MPYNNSWRWNDETTSELRQMWSDGLTGTMICQEFQNKRGISPTRCAVMGKVCRSDGFAKRNRFVKAKRIVEKPRGKYKPRSKFVSIFDRVSTPVPDSPALAASNPGTLMELKSHDCRWPVDGAGADALFCRDRKHENYPYCLAHCRLAYRPVPRREAA